MSKLSARYYSVILLVLLTAHSTVAAQAALRNGGPNYNCANYYLYSPCVCTGDSRGVGLTCRGLSVNDITSVFQRALPINHFDYIELQPTFSGHTQQYDIPANWLAGKTAASISLSCGPEKYDVSVNPYAFVNATSGHFSVDSCNLTIENDVAFLTYMRKLDKLSVTNCLNVRGFINFGASVSDMEIVNCTGLGETFEYFHVRDYGKRMNLAGNGLSDDQVNRLVDTTGYTPTGKSLGYLGLANNRITSIPSNLSKLLRLYQLDLSHNSIAVVDPFEIKGLAVTDLNLDNNVITTIAPAAFQQGNYISARISLRNNRLTKFEQSVFKDVLVQMHSTQLVTGYIDVAGNAFDCAKLCGDDGLGWLVKDNRHLLTRVLNARCSDGTSFADLNPSSSCPDNNNQLKNCTNSNPSDGCSGKGNGNYAYSSGCCANFYMCSNNIQSNFNCAQSGLAYDSTIRQCNYAYNVSACLV